ncbi:MAG: ATP-binding protein [Chloroflexota bacterium]
MHPIQELTAATEAMATGDLKQHVPIRSEDELGRLARSFNQMSADLAEATRQRRQMTADIAHDLGTPLQIISGYVESMTDGTLAPTMDRLGLISAEIEHLRRLIEDLDLLSQTDTQSLRLQMQPIDTATFLEQIALSFTPIAKPEGVQLKTNIGDTLPVIEADQERLMQVMGNLLSNALRYTPGGERIIISGQRQDDQVVLQVKDHGAGIAPEDLPYIFERFYRADTSRTEGGKMGLGLAISKALVEAMNGAISAHSQGVGQGTTLTVSFPTKLN